MVCISGFAPRDRLIGRTIIGRIIAVMTGVMIVEAMGIEWFVGLIGAMASDTAIADRPEGLADSPSLWVMRRGFGRAFFWLAKDSRQQTFQKNRSECVKVAWIIVIARLVSLLSRESRLK